MNFNSIKEKFLFDKVNFIISIDEQDEMIRFFYKGKKEKTFSLESEHFKSHIYDDEFFETLKKIIKIYFEKKGGKAVLVLPNRLFFSDTIKLPLVNKQVLQSSLSLAFNTIYKNSDQLKYNAFPIFHDKKNVVYSIIGIRKDILSKFVSAVESCGINLVGVTYSANAMANGAISLNSKIRNANCVVVDVKQNYSSLALLLGGKTVGYYDIPFGENALSSDTVNFEEDLFDHTLAELLVLNAKELAKKKKLTTLDEQYDEETAEDLTFDEQDDESNANSKKVAFKSRKSKKLPKFMLRDLPTDQNQFVYENFRYIIKRVLEVVRNNYKFENFADIKIAFVNLPKKFSYLVDYANAENGDKVEFSSVYNNSDQQLALSNLELFGATLVRKINVKNNF